MYSEQILLKLLIRISLGVRYDEQHGPRYTKPIHLLLQLWMIVGMWLNNQARILFLYCSYVNDNYIAFVLGNT